MMHGVGSRLREARLAAGLSGRALAAKAGLSPTAINKIELGKSGVSLEAIERIADALGLHPRELSHGVRRVTPEEREAGRDSLAAARFKGGDEVVAGRLACRLKQRDLARFPGLEKDEIEAIEEDELVPDARLRVLLETILDRSLRVINWPDYDAYLMAERTARSWASGLLEFAMSDHGQDLQLRPAEMMVLNGMAHDPKYFMPQNPEEWFDLALALRRDYGTYGFRLIPDLPLEVLLPFERERERFA